MDELSDVRQVPQGTLRIISSFGFGRRVVAPALSELARRYPQLEIRFDVADRLVDLANEGVDVDIRVGDDIAPNLIARQLASNHRILCASPARLVKGQILKPWDSGIGYMQVGITIDGKRANKYVHSLAAQTFIKNTDNLPEVNHKSCDRSDNRVSNLEWCSRSYNMKYREKFGISNTESLGRPVFAVNLKTLEVSRYPSQHEASRELGLFQPSVNNVIKGRYKYTNGYWFVNDDENADDAIKRKLQTLQSQALGL